MDTPFSLTLVLSVSEDSQVRSSGFGDLPVERKAEGSASFASTLSFPLSGPVFDLPDGYTGNSESGGIVDNRWIFALARPVSEPATIALLGLGLAGLGFMRRRRAA